MDGCGFCDDVLEPAQGGHVEEARTLATDYRGIRDLNRIVL